MERFPTESKVPRTILAFDTAMSGCSVACGSPDTGIYHERVIPMRRGQAEKLVPMIDEVIREAGISYDSINAIATTVGPGAFTGLRIGLSTARSLGLALGIDVYGFSTLDMIVQRFIHAREDRHDQDGEDGKAILVVLETKRQDFYTQIFTKSGESLTKPMALDTADIFSVIDDINYPVENIIVIGDAVERFQQESCKYDRKDFAYKLIHRNEFCLPIPSDMIRMLKNGCKTLPATPLYLREADVSKSKKKYRIIDNLK